MVHESCANYDIVDDASGREKMTHIVLCRAYGICCVVKVCYNTVD